MNSKIKDVSGKKDSDESNLSIDNMTTFYLKQNKNCKKTLSKIVEQV